INDDNNVYTLLVGRNGVGKSVLLQKLIQSFVPFREAMYERRFMSSDDLAVTSVFVTRMNFPSKIIASSTSPFDKFPIDRRRTLEGVYEYLGLKGLPSVNLSLGFIGRTFGSLIKALEENDGHLNAILKVFKYLNYAPYMKARMVLDLVPNKIVEIISSSDPTTALLAQMEKRGNSYFKSESGRNTKFSSKQIGDVLMALEFFIATKSKPRIDIVISELGARDGDTWEPISRVFSTLLEAGLLRIRDVTLRKIGMRDEIRINDASSGEQCVLMALLGIASHIQNDSLILIDEPEICLHPEWQEKYIELLMESFSNFKNCHFIIATHSPQVVSNLASRNCYVLDMQKNHTRSASEVNKKSADFQLANVFGVPGYKNEYLSRELISALGILGSGGELSYDKLNLLRNIIALKDSIDPSDPVSRLIELLSAALEEV
ncbi:AAA family ATPase, partial [Pseudomonas helleri]